MNTCAGSNKIVVPVLVLLMCVSLSGSAAGKDALNLSAYMSRGKLEFSAPDNSWRLRIGGRFQFDAAEYSDDDPPPLAGGNEVRRARLFASGTYLQDWDFKFQYDFTFTGQNTALDGLKDAYVAYKGFDQTAIKIGHFKEPFSLEEMDSSKYITFMERALPNAFSPGRNIGIGVHTYGDTWTAATGFYGGGLQQPVLGGYGVTGRVTFSPIHEKNRVLHLGISASWRSSNDDDKVRFRERPESHVTDLRLVDTGSFDADSYHLLGLEAIGLFGPFAVQGEYMRTDVNGSDDAGLDGYYLEASWFLTGESRRYNFKGGKFSGVKAGRPVGKGGVGAWQLAARFSHIDLTDGNIRGGKEDNLTAGINWYLNSNLRVTANYVKVLDADGGKSAGARPGILQLRAQVHW